MARLTIVHFQPVERYPPVVNLVKYLAERYADLKIDLITTKFRGGSSEFFKSTHANLSIRRAGVLPERMGALSRALCYARFNAEAALRVIGSKPGVLLYYETLSAFPAWVSRVFFGNGTRTFVHYHEYTSPQEYRSGMRLVRWLHGLEQRMYGGMEWISHTNQYRMERFIADEHLRQDLPFRIMPNYPPIHWKRAVKTEFSLPLRIVYVGALSRETMFLDAFAEWVEAQNGMVLWDIFSGNMDESARAYLAALSSGNIRFRGAVTYDSLPDVLEDYHVGVILYKGHIPNYVINAPNKLFEYLACGLDVWFPELMQGSVGYVRDDALPRVTAMDFKRLHEVRLEKVLDRAGLSPAPDRYFAEDIYGEIADKLVE